MKLIGSLSRSARLTPPEKHIKFRELRPLILENEVSTSGQKTADTSCLQEMAVMFACLKDKEFIEEKCHKEVQTFLTCYSQYKTKKAETKARDQSGIIPPGSNPRNFTPRQLNKILKKYPQNNK